MSSTAKDLLKVFGPDVDYSTATAGGVYLYYSAVGASKRGVLVSDVPFLSRNNIYIHHILFFSRGYHVHQGQWVEIARGRKSERGLNVPFDAIGRPTMYLTMMATARLQSF